MLAKAGIQGTGPQRRAAASWIAAFAGMTRGFYVGAKVRVVPSAMMRGQS